MIKVWTSSRSWYWAFFVDVVDSDHFSVRCISHEHIHIVSKGQIH